MLMLLSIILCGVKNIPCFFFISLFNCLVISIESSLKFVFLLDMFIINSKLYIILYQFYNCVYSCYYISLHTLSILQNIKLYDINIYIYGSWKERPCITNIK